MVHTSDWLTESLVGPSLHWVAGDRGQQVTYDYTGPDISPGGFPPALIITVTIAPIEQFPGGSSAVGNCAQVQHPDDVNPENDQSCVTTVITPSGRGGSLTWRL